MAVLQGSAKSVADGGFYPTEIAQSLRFNDDDSAYLSRTPSVAGNRKTWTFSCWFKVGNLGTARNIFNCRVSGPDRTEMRLNSDDTLFIIDDDVSWQLVTTQVFRDPSAWYHLVISVDTTQSTASDRVKVYINGTRVTSFSTETYPSLNYDTRINSTATHQIGRTATTDYFDGYLAEVHFTDGTAYTADDFGEFKSGVWVAKTPVVTYGTNGFYLKFANSGALGTDSSGNSNTWTPTNLAATDVMLDSPTNNFATLNPLVSLGGAAVTYSEGNLKATATTNGVNSYSNSTISIPSGSKCYFEVYIGNVVPSWCSFGVYDVDNSSSNSYVAYYTLAAKTVKNSADSQTGLTIPSAGDIFGIAFDNDAGTIQYYRNGVAYGNQITGMTAGEFIARSQTIQSASVNAIQFFNFGQDSSFAGTKTPQGNTDANGIGDFYYAPPTGYLALCTANLPEPAISPLNDASPSDYMNTVLYTGDGTSSHAITGLGFQPDLVWIKNRGSAGENHGVYDVNRSSGSAVLYPNLTLAETDGGYLELDADGFTVNTGNQNASGNNYVAWNWKANGTPVTNTDGTITSSVSANTTSGFSIVTATATSGSQTMGHGLSSAPEMIISKSRTNGTTSWASYHADLGNNYYVSLNTTAAAASVSNYWTVPTATTIGYGYGGSGDNAVGDMVYYCFHSVEGFSKIGSYTGNGSTDGPFVYCGFKPAFVMVKMTSGTDNWIILDNARDIDNVAAQCLYANLSNAEGGPNNDKDFLSNGFKCRKNEANLSGSNYIYMAFAENPFKYSNAR